MKNGFENSINLRITLGAEEFTFAPATKRSVSKTPTDYLRAKNGKAKNSLSFCRAMTSAIGWYGPLIDLSGAALHVGDFVQLLVLVHRSTPVQVSPYLCVCV